MIEKTYETEKGVIHYFVSERIADRPALVFLPGLTADHRLFEKQIPFFEGRYTVLVWDAPGHNRSWPFSFAFDLFDKARWLHGILDKEDITKYVIIGQSMGGYVAQVFMQEYPDELAGFVSIDSCPIQKKYMKKWEIAALKKMEPVYRFYPWKSLLKSGTNGVSETDYGRKLMREMMMTYDRDQDRYARLAGHGYRILAEAVEKDLPYEIDCPALLMCGTKDKAGEAKKYNRMWEKETGIPIRWLEGAGHNANTDQPEKVNSLIEEFLEEEVR